MAAGPARKGGSVKSSTRVQLELPEKSMARLLALKEITEATSYADVIRNALRLYEVVINETEAGNQFLLKEKDGQVTPFRIFAP